MNKVGRNEAQNFVYFIMSLTQLRCELIETKENDTQKCLN